MAILIADEKEMSTAPSPESIVKILIVDDEESVRLLLSRIMSGNGYDYCLVAGAAEARRALENEHFDLILCDVKMPGENGIGLIKDVRKKYPDTAVMMVTAVDDPEIVDTAMAIGAYGFVVKPFNANELIINIANVLHRLKLEIKDRCHRESLESLVASRTEELRKTLNQQQKAAEGIIRAMAMTVGARDSYTAGHQRRVAQLAEAVARLMNLSEDQILGIKMAGEIHDLGKIAIPAEILAKPSHLTDAEFDMIKSHPQVGYKILKDIEFPWPIAQMVVQHHEKLNGSGYPAGLSGDKILLGARILTVADVVEAMASHRPYRPALGIEAALQEISEHKGTWYDSDVVAACLKLFENNKAFWDQKPPAGRKPVSKRSANIIKTSAIHDRRNSAFGR